VPTLDNVMDQSPAPRRLTPDTAVNRYTLRVLIATSGGRGEPSAELWQAYDPVLDRPVALRLVLADDPRATDVAAAARAAATVDERHLVPVLDVLDRVVITHDELPGSAEYTVIVHEWALGSTLADVFEQREGEPLPVADAINLARQAALALAAAHRVGVSHRRIRPGALLISGSTAPEDDGEVRIRGLGVDAALWAPVATSPGTDPDVHGVGCLLYAAVTARWPGGLADGISSAPTHAGSILAPSQVRAEVPGWLDDICARAIDPQIWGPWAGRGKKAPLVFADMDALLAALGAPAEHSDPSRRVTLTASFPVSPAASSRSSTLATLGKRSLGVAAAIALTAGVGAAGLQVVNSAASPWGSQTDPLPTQVLTSVGDASPASDAITDYNPGSIPGQLTPVSAISYDPSATGAGDSPELAELAIDANSVTSWVTETYFAPDLTEEDGVGLVVDLGAARAISAVRLQLAGIGSSISIKVGSQPDAAIGDWALLAEADTIGDTIDLRSPRPVVGRYLLVWFTRLPPVNGAYLGGIREVAVLNR
jgi:putative peptidoglycan lipid II flippase